MRVTVFLFVSVVMMITCHAQSAHNIDLYPNSEMVQRWNSSTKLAIAATTVDPTGKNKKKKSDPSLQNSFQGKTFEGGGGSFGKKLSGQEAFRYEEKVTTGKYGTRSLFGLKNPWFGKKVVETEKASLWSKSAVANADKKYPLDAVEMREFYGADKKASERLEAIPTRSTTVEPKSQGFMNSISEQKNLTVEQVRELLNKK